MRDSEAREVERAEERKGGGDCSEKREQERETYVTSGRE